MGDREYRQQKQILEVENRAAQGHADYEEPASSERYTSQGAIPPVETEWVDLDKRPPTASELAYGDARGIKPTRHALGPAGAPNLNAPSVQISTGHPLVDKRLGCSDVPLGTNGCFLDPERRTLLLSECHTRILRAEIHFTSALNQLRVDELLKKEPEKSEWMMELFLDVIGQIGVSTVVKAFHALKSGKLGSVQPYVENANQLSAAINASSDAQLTTALGIAVGQGKAAATKKLGAQTDTANAEQGTQKTANVGYLSYLEGRAGKIYQYMSEGMVAGLSDSLLLTLTDAFETDNHSVEVYKAELSAKLKRFEHSGVSKLGITKNEDFHPISDTAWQHDTRAFWVKTPLGKRLGLYQRTHQAIPATVRVGSVDREATPFDKITMEMEDFAARPYTFVRYVPVEFEHAAVAMHISKWHSDPVERVAQTHEEVAFAGMTQ